MKKNENLVKVVMADDHLLLRNALATLINGFGNCTVIFDCGTGKEVINFIEKVTIPDVVILDLNMPDMDGFQTAEWLQQNYPQVHVLMLTMYDSELSLIRLLKKGVGGFLKKDIHPEELKFAICSVMQSGYYYSNHTAGKLINLFRSEEDGNVKVQKAILSDQEIEFLKLTCTDLTYKEVAERMRLNPRTVDSLRDQLFLKLDVRSRVGLAILAIKHGIYTF